MSPLTLISDAHTSSNETASVVAEYLAFERRRVARRQYLKAFGGMAFLVGLGALVGRVPAGEAAIVSGLLLAPPALLTIVEVPRRRRLARHLDHVRALARAEESRKKVVSAARDRVSSA